MAIPNAAPIRRNMTVLATDVGRERGFPEKAADPDRVDRAVQRLQDMGKQNGSANWTSPRLIEPSVKERGRA